MNKLNKLTYILLPILTVVALLLLWFFASLIVGEELILPSPWQAIAELWNLLGRGEFWLSLGGTFSRSLIAFFCSFILASGLAILSKFSKKLSKIISMIISILRAVPTIAIVLLLLLWTNSKIAAMVVTMVVVLPVIFGAFLDSFGRIDYKVIEMCNVYNISKCNQFRSYIFPQVLPSTIVTIGRGLALNIKLMVAAEVLAGTANSIGILMSQSKIYFETAELFALVVFTIIFAVIVEFVMLKISRIVGRKYGFREDK